MLNIISKLANAKVIAFLTLLFFFFALYIFPWYHEPLKAIVGNQYLNLDVKIGYDINYVRNFFEALGLNGRVAYLRNEIEADMIFPVIYNGWAVLSLYFLLSRCFPSYAKWCLISFFPMFCDIAENSIIIYSLVNFPDLNTGLIQLCSYLTILKYTFAYGAGLVVIGLFVYWLIYRKKLSVNA